MARLLLSHCIDILLPSFRAEKTDTTSIGGTDTMLPTDRLCFDVAHMSSFRGLRPFQARRCMQGIECSEAW
ncbi:hypothetical protein LX36DRAFT_219550 [Colletotrichum falcatum]|nr:hypothetical protein LX36DRAFT_219550 [Colletotrichum falcatum]